MPGIEPYSSTHTRIDSLGWGVLLGLLVNYYEEFLVKRKKQLLLLFIGGLILIFCKYSFIRTFSWQILQKHNFSYGSSILFLFNDTWFIL
jgi:C4-dicarboxylate transporter